MQATENIRYPHPSLTATPSKMSLRGVFNKVCVILTRWLLVWEMTCGTYMLEPIERIIIQGTLFAVLGVLVFAAMTYLPGHMIMMFYFLEGVHGT